MILNVFSLTLLFISLVTLALLLAGGAGTLFLRAKVLTTHSVAARRGAEARLYLVFLLLATALLLRGLAWPLLYLMLQSFIPDVPGAMCIYGTTQVAPLLIRFLELIKPAIFFLTGAWFIVYGLSRAEDTPLLVKRNLFLFWIVWFLSGLDAGGDMALALSYRPPGIPVSCCTVIGDILLPAAPSQPASILDARHGPVLILLYHGVHLVGAGILAFLLATRRWRPDAKGYRASLLLAFLLGTLSIGITFSAMLDRIGPTLMKLPHHHCPYCLLQTVPLSILFMGLEVLGSFALGWACIAGMMARGTEQGSVLPATVRRLWITAAVALSASWAIVSVLFSRA